MQAFMSRFLRSPCLTTIPIPKPEPDELLVEVAYVSLNPTDCTPILLPTTTGGPFLLRSQLKIAPREAR